MSDSIFALKFTVANGGTIFDQARKLASFEAAIERVCQENGADVFVLTDWKDELPTPEPKPEPAYDPAQTPAANAKRRRTMRRLWSLPAQRKRFLAALAAGRAKAAKARLANR